MLQLKDITKSYITGDYVQKALDGVSIDFRDNEFVAVLGPSGSGKTTMLNVLGGLDRADSGSLIINGISTKDYKSSDWDTYRNHRIGFIFQSYNLIPHQTVLQNVELALTLSGVSRGERKERARQVLAKVGLEDHVNKKPSQMSGGQMQRVAIARALVNDPDIVLADEPTGALDTDTGIQVMNLLQEIAADRLVVMVTHNPELAETYATRIVSLKDGHIVADSNPVAEEELAAALGTACIGLGAAVGETPEKAAAAELDAAELGAENLDAADATLEFPAAAAAAPAAAADTTLEFPASAAAAPAAAADATLEFPASVEGAPAATSSAAQVGDSREGSKGKKASMSFLTALSLSFTNLMTKKGRTIMTAIAGSIGIIGIAAILSLSNGVNNYINKVEEDTLSSAPIQITKASYDMTGIMTVMMENAESEDTEQLDTSTLAEDGSTLIKERKILENMFSGIESNDLVSLKEYIESDETDIYDHVNAIQYDYGITPYIYVTTQKGTLEQVNPSPVNDSMGSNMGVASYMMSFNAFGEMLDAQKLLQGQYEVLAGRWPNAFDECLIVISADGTIPDYDLYHLGFYDMDDLVGAFDTALELSEVEFPEVDPAQVTYADLLDLEFKAIPQALLYKHNEEQGTWTLSEDENFIALQSQKGVSLKVTGVMRPKAGSRSRAMGEGIYYSSQLVPHLIQLASDADIVKAQLADENRDVFTGKTFEELQSDDALDMSEMFTINEEAIQKAFSFDTSALDLGGMDFGGLDLSDIGNSLDLDAMMANMPAPDVSNMELDLDPAVQQQVAGMALQISSGFLPWYYENNPGAQVTPETDMTEPFAAYLQTEEVQAQIALLEQIAGPSINDAFATMMQDYMASVLQPFMANAMEQLGNQVAAAVEQQMMAAMAGLQASLGASLGNAFSFDPEVFANAFQFNMDEEDFTALMSSYVNAGQLTYDNNLRTLGYATDADIQSINIYPKDFVEKDAVAHIIDDYNNAREAAGEDEKVVSYTDIMGVLMSSVNDIVDKITKILIAFVSISLVVSSIMIGIITYISVLERKKEIGILRAMGASKRNVANIFNAETIIEGFVAGVLAIAVVVLISIPVNILISRLENVENIMILPVSSAIILICISMALTLIAGLLPALSASKKDPVEALRSE